jgi:glycosyltransferase involved in cell wall biosynthesis
MNKTKILVAVGGYLPGYKAGGPIRSIANLIKLLGDEFQFSVITADRDLGEREPYPGIRPGLWYPVGKAQVRYFAPEEYSCRNMRRILSLHEYDLIYLNSFFMKLSIKVLLLRLVHKIPKRPILLAPLGEFSPGAIALKAYKKRPYIWLTKLIGLYKGVFWHASSEFEAADIRREMTAGVQNIHIVPDLVDVRSMRVKETRANKKVVGRLQVIFLSRISRKKNLDYALRLFANIQGDIQFDIYGPIEDKRYWQECQQLVAELPHNIQVRYCGLVLPDQVPKVFSKYNLFLFPTRGENFGHVIIESLMAGCPVLISDLTMWRDLEKKGVGWDLPLSEPKRFHLILKKIIEMDNIEFETLSNRATVFASVVTADQEENNLQSYRYLFRRATIL